MTATPPFEIFLAAIPGLENELRAEARALGFGKSALVKGGVTMDGTWADVWRANLELRGASRVLARIASFRVLHLAQLDKRARRVPWSEILRPDVPFSVEATCRSSRVYHSGAAAQRIERAIRETLGAPAQKDAPITIMARIEDDLCTLSVDTSGDGLHKRGHKEAVNKAPMRETMAALILRRASYTGTEPVLDPMCGSGTFVIEAAEIAAGLKPGRSRSFAFEQLATFDPGAWNRLKASAAASTTPAVRFSGSDRDAGAIRMSTENAARAGVTAVTDFSVLTVSEISPPAGSGPGLVVINPPYGDRLGDKGKLAPLYRSLGQSLLTRFPGWRVALITNERPLALATGLPFTATSAPISHGGLRVQLYLTEPLP